MCLFTSGESIASSIPSAADPSRAISGTQDNTLDFDKAEPKQAPEKLPIAPNAPEGSDKAFFILKTIDFKGMTAYSIEDIEEIYRKDLGQKISVTRLFEIMNSIQKRYLDDGYSLSRVGMPTQDISGGIVTFQVIEGYAEEVTFEGEMASNPVLEDALLRISSLRPLNTKKLERILLLLNDFPDFNVSAILGAVKSPNPAPGAIRLTLKQNPTLRSTASIGVNNYGSEFSGPFQIVSTLKQPKILSSFDELSATISAAIPLREMKYIGVKYQRPLWGASGLLWGIEATLGKTAPGSTLEDLVVKGKSDSLKTYVSYPVIRQRDETLRIMTGMEMKHTHTDLLFDELYDDHLSIFSAGATYNSSDSYKGLNALEVTYTQGLGIFGASQAGADNLSRSEGKPEFQKFFASIGRVQALPYNFDILTTIQGQYTADPLLSSEEFGFGGGQSGRGYDPSEITGDKGIAATIELRKNMSLPSRNMAIQVYGFYDFGKVWNIDPGSKDRLSAASSGLGVRAGLPSGWSADVNMAIPLTRTPENPPKYTSGKSPRALLSIQKKF
jgi:hemolysin activation/secretion protein